MLTEPRPLFKGKEAVNDITGKSELYYPEWKRQIFRYFVTVPVISACLLVVFTSMVLLLRLQDWWDDEVKVFSFVPGVLLAIVLSLIHI